jgi:hypothetical protein
VLVSRIALNGHDRIGKNVHLRLKSENFEMAKKTKRTLSNPWTKENVRELNAMVKEGIPRATIARKLKPKRTVSAVQQQIHKLGLSLRTAAKKAKKVARKVVKVAKAKVTGAKVAKVDLPRFGGRLRA